jgi:Fe2+ transport system protein FeoA
VERRSAKCEVPLTALRNGQSGTVTSIRAGHRGGSARGHGRGQTRGWGWGRGRIFEKRLTDLGLTPGTRVTVVGLAPFHGPLEILVRGSRLALGRGIAERIFVEIDEG